MISLSNIFANKLVMLVGDVGQVCLNAVMACEPKEVLFVLTNWPRVTGAALRTCFCPTSSPFRPF